MKIYLLVFQFAHRWTLFDFEFVLDLFLLFYNVVRSGFPVNDSFVAIDDCFVFDTEHFHSFFVLYRGTDSSCYNGPASPGVPDCDEKGVQHLYLGWLENLSFGCSSYSPSWFVLDPNEFRIYKWMKGARWSIIESICSNIIIRFEGIRNTSFSSEDFMTVKEL